MPPELKALMCDHTRGSTFFHAGCRLDPQVEQLHYQFVASFLPLELLSFSSLLAHFANLKKKKKVYFAHFVGRNETVDRCCSGGSYCGEIRSPVAIGAA